MISVRGVTRYGRFAAKGRNAAGDWSGFTRHRSSLNDRTGERAGSAITHSTTNESSIVALMQRSCHCRPARSRAQAVTVRTKAISVIHAKAKSPQAASAGGSRSHWISGRE
jgi:hypothetical protein